jgi:hypothetical protein
MIKVCMKVLLLSVLPCLNTAEYETESPISIFIVVDKPKC